MKKLLVCVFAIGLCFWSCSQTEEWAELSSPKDEVQDMEIQLPQASEDFGKAIAGKIGTTMEKLVEMNVDYSDADGSKEFRDRFYNDFYQINSYSTKKKSQGEIAYPTITPEQFAEGYASLSEIQVGFIHKIIEECDKSTSDHDLLVRLVSLRDKICEEVPEIEQERLLNVISMLFYSVQELNRLAAQGMTLKTTNNVGLFPRLMTSSEGGGGNEGGSNPSVTIPPECRTFLSSIWIAATIEPTPVGEVIAFIGTTVIAGVIMYQYMACPAESSSSDDITNSDFDYCVERYTNCEESNENGWAERNSGGKYGHSMCYECYNDCLLNGVWDCPRPKM